MDALFGIGRPLRRAQPHIIIESFGNRHGRLRAGGWIHTEADFDGVQLSDPAVANQFARPAPARIGTLLASHLKDAAIPADRIAQDTPFFDGQAERLLQKDILARLGRGDGRQHVPVVRRGNTHRIDILLGDQVSVITVAFAPFIVAAGSLPTIMGFDGFLSVFNAIGIDIAHGNHLGLPESQNLSHIVHAHPPDTDKAERNPIARRLGTQNRRRHDGRPQQNRSGRRNRRAFKKLPTSDNACLLRPIVFHISIPSKIFGTI